MPRGRSNKLVSMMIAGAVASASLLVAAEPASAAGALFRAKRTWWFTYAGYPGVYVYTNGHSEPPTSLPSAIGNVGTTPTNPSFTAPRSFIKTALTYICAYNKTPLSIFPCYNQIGIPKFTNRSSYWNAKGSFRPSNPNAPTTTTTVRVRTVSDGWPGPVTRLTPTVMYTRATPTEGGCSVGNPGSITHPAQCPGTTRFSGLYTASRGGSIMISPGSKRFGGTMRFFDGPNASFYQLHSISSPYRSTNISYPAPTSQQIGTGVEFEVGEVIRGGGSRYLQQGRFGDQYRLTYPFNTQRLIFGTTSLGGSCTQRPPPYPPNGSRLCASEDDQPPGNACPFYNGNGPGVATERLYQYDSNDHWLRQPNYPRYQRQYLDGSPALGSHLRRVSIGPLFKADSDDVVRGSSDEDQLPI